MIFDKVRDFDESENIFYFCRFDRDNPLVGKELLMHGNGSIMKADGSFESFMHNITDSLSEDIYYMPLFVPFDYISSIFPDIPIKRSELPLMQSFVPDEVISGQILRQKSHISAFHSAPFHDHELSEKIAGAVERIRAGELLQVVLSRRFELPEMDLISVARKNLQSDLSLYVFYYRSNGIEISGSSPENLVSRSGENLEIFPIAGTINRSSDIKEDSILGSHLMNSEKDKLEHRMLVDLARNDLGKVSATGTVRVERSMFLRKYASVQHIVSHVTSRLKDGLGNSDVIKATFPAGTVSGAPKKRAVQLISEYEDSERGPYSGAIGLVGKDSMDLALLIRSVFRYQNHCYTQAGAGIVKDSDPAMEVQEMFNKSISATGGMLNESIDNR